MKKIILISVILQLAYLSYSQEIVSPSKVKWYTIEEAEELAKKQLRPIFVDVHTEWCGWCKYMMKTTFANEHIANYLNNNYYPVRFDAETQDTIIYKGDTLVNKSTKKRSKHELAYKLLDRFSFPSLVFLDTKGNKEVIPGYIDVKSFEPIMYYFAENINISTDFDKFERYFRASYPNNRDSTTLELIKGIDTLGSVNWHSFEEVMELQKKAPRKIFIHIDAGWRVGSYVMKRTTYRNKKIADYINKNYYPIYFNALTKEEISAFGQVFINEQKSHPFHDLAVSMLQKKMIFPATLVLNEQYQLINRMQEYLSPELLEPILYYFGENANKTKKWEDYKKSFKSGL